MSLTYSYTQTINEITDNIQAFSITSKELKKLFSISDFENLFGKSFKTNDYEDYIINCFNVSIEKIVNKIFSLPLDEKVDLFHKEVMSKQNIEFKKLQTLKRFKELDLSGNVSYKENIKEIKKIIKEADSISKKEVNDTFENFIKNITKEEIHSFLFDDKFIIQLQDKYI